MVSYPLGDFATVPLVTAPLRALIPRQAQRAAVIPTVSNTVSVSLHIDERAGRQHEKGDSDERPTHQGDRRTTSIVLVGRAVHASLLEPIHQEGALRDLCQRQASVDLERCLRGRAKHFRKACPHVVACGMGIGPATIKPSVPFFVWVPCGGSRKRRTDCCRRPGSRTPHTPRRSSAKRGLQSRFVQNGRRTTAGVPFAFNESQFRALPSVASGLVVLLLARLTQKPSPSARNSTALAGKPPTFVCLAK